MAKKKRASSKAPKSKRRSNELKIFRYIPSTRAGVKSAKPFNVIADSRTAADIGAGVALRERIKYKVVEIQGADASFQIATEKKVLGSGDRMVLYRNLAQFTRGQRQSTTAALRYVAPMMNRPYLRGIVGQLAVLGDRGYKLSQAMEKIGGFSEFEIAQIKVAEDTGKTDSIADALADFFVSKREQGSAIRRAVTIPAVTMVLALVAYGVLGLAVLPKFEKLYEESGKFPMLASFTVNVSEFLFGNWFIFIPLLILAMIFRLKIKDWLWSFPSVQRGFIRLPFIGEIQGMILLGQSFQALSIMTQSGKTLASSYEFLDRMISQIDFKEYFHLIRANSIAGYGTGDAFYEASATLPVKGEGDRVASIMSATESLGDPSESIQLLAQEYYVVMRDFLATIEKKVMLAGSLCAFIFVSPALIGTARVIMNLSQTIG